MNTAVSTVQLANLMAIGALPLVFFRRDGRLNLMWWLTALPFFIATWLLTAAMTGLWQPGTLIPAPFNGLTASGGALLSLASVALIAFTLGSHDRPQACISHRPSTADDDPPAVTGRAPSGLLNVVSTTPSSPSSARAPSRQGLDALATNTGEKYRLALWHQNNDDPQHLVTHGAYRHIRHPFYSAFLLAQAGVALHLPHPATILLLVYTALILSYTARREEQRLLASPFGNAYRAYMRRSGRFVPKGSARHA